MPSRLALIMLVALIETLNGVCSFGRNRFEFGAAFQFKAGEDGLHALFLRELLVLVVYLEAHQRIFLASRMVSATGAVLILEEDAYAHLLSMGKVLKRLIVLPHTHGRWEGDLAREQLCRFVGRVGSTIAADHFQLFAADWSPGYKSALVSFVESSRAEARVLRNELVVHDLARLHQLLLLGRRVELHLTGVEVSEA